MQTLYQILGVSKDASLKDIKAAYLKLVLVCHPDKNPSANPDDFIRIHSAYEILSNPEERKKYDAKSSSGLDEDELKEYFYSSLDEIRKKLPEVILRYQQKIKEKDKDLDALFYENQFLTFINNLIFQKSLDALMSGQDIEITNKAQEEFTKLHAKYQQKIMNLTLTPVLKLQDQLNGYLQASWPKGVRVKPNISSYHSPLSFTISVWDCVDKSANFSNRQKIETIIQKSPLASYIEIKPVRDISDNIAVGRIDCRVKVEYFSDQSRNSTQNLLFNSQSSNFLTQEEKIAQYKERLFAYIEARRTQEKYTGSKWGYSREEKLNAAQGLLDLLSERTSIHTFFCENKHYKTNFKALTQRGSALKEASKEAMEYVETVLKPKLKM